MAEINLLEERDIYEIAYLTQKGWEFNPWGGWNKEGQAVRDCKYNDHCSGCTGCFDRVDLTREEAYDKQEQLDDKQEQLERIEKEKK